MDQAEHQSESALYSKQLGRYLLHCCLNDFSFAHGKLAESLEGFVVADAKSGALIPKKSKRPVDLPSISPFLTWQHEREHYRALMSTATGILLWRLNTDILSTASYMVRKINCGPAGETIRAPFQDWYEATGKALIAADPPYDPAVAESLGLTEKEFRRITPAVMELKARELETLQRFQTGFLGNQKMPMREFVDVANRAAPILADRSGIEGHRRLRWRARDESRPSQLPDPDFTVAELLEADARLYEHIALLSAGGSREHLQEWRRKHIFGIYKRAYDWLLAELGDPSIARAAIEIALMGPVDPAALPATHPAAGAEVWVEDAHPSWRLVRIVRALQETLWPWEVTERESMVSHRLSERAGIPSPRDVIASLVSAPLRSAEALYGDADLAGYSHEETSTPYHEFVESMIRLALSRKQKNPLDAIFPKGTSGLKPLLEFYNDCAVVNLFKVRDGKLQPFKESPRLIYQAIMELVAGLAIFALLGNGDVSDLPFLERSFTSGIRISGAGDILPMAPLNVKDMVESIVGKNAAARLRWAAY
jgi:hypothetical protein